MKAWTLVTLRASGKPSISLQDTAAVLRTIASLSAALALVSGCTSTESKRADTLAAGSTATVPATTPLPPGEAMLSVRGGRIWYKRSGNGTGTPIELAVAYQALIDQIQTVYI